MGIDAEVAQVVEHGTENAGVASSTLALGMPEADRHRKTPHQSQRAEVAQW